MLRIAEGKNVILPSDDFVIYKREGPTMLLELRGKYAVLTRETAKACDLLQENDPALQNGSLRPKSTLSDAIGVKEARMIGAMVAVNTTLAELSLNCKRIR